LGTTEFLAKPVDLNLLKIRLGKSATPPIQKRIARSNGRLPLEPIDPPPEKAGFSRHRDSI
jgi:hypothetical protein